MWNWQENIDSYHWTEEKNLQKQNQKYARINTWQRERFEPVGRGQHRDDVSLDSPPHMSHLIVLGMDSRCKWKIKYETVGINKNVDK